MYRKLSILKAAIFAQLVATSMHIVAPAVFRLKTMAVHGRRGRVMKLSQALR
jgi:hypothetical protein